MPHIAALQNSLPCLRNYISIYISAMAGVASTALLIVAVSR
jgi:hypothetical protein